MTDFDPQDASNQAIACVIGGMQLGDLLAAAGEREVGESMRAAAMRRLYLEKIRPTRATDRGYAYFQEHSGGFDQNYSAIALTFVTEAYLATGETVFAADAEQHARYLNLRMSVSGFDYGGARHNEERDNSPNVLGLRFWSNALGDDLGRYRTDSSRAFHMDSADGVPTGHFAFTTIWLMEHRQEWWPSGRDENSRYKLRKGTTSVVFDESLVPYSITAGQTEIIHQIGPYWTDEHGLHRLTNLVSVARSEEYTDGQYAVKVIHSVVQGPHGVVGVRTAYMTDGTTLTVMSTVDNEVSGEFGYLVGLPYLTGTPPASKVTSVTCDGVRMNLTDDGRSLTGSAVTAGELTLSGGAGIRVTNVTVPAGGDPMSYFNSAATVGMLLEPYSLIVFERAGSLGCATSRRRLGGFTRNHTVAGSGRT
ncbi:hypothetical protein [Fodinicola feengrottensis]|uniref:hypothetical protein n=1 Tax=Fodinicola feengrottensis TaxID=435914 RepID=UPI0013D31E86|nr:hypothetical protein [Fodinicola feengrottensis]